MEEGNHPLSLAVVDTNLVRATRLDHQQRLKPTPVGKGDCARGVEHAIRCELGLLVRNNRGLVTAVCALKLKCAHPVGVALEKSSGWQLAGDCVLWWFGHT